MRFGILAAAALALSLGLTEAAQAQEIEALISIGGPVEVDTFHQRLAPYGRWVYAGDYGEVWVPNGVRPGWRPYWDGRWALTEYGWTFVSDDPWGWATWHYGNWTYVDGYGWAWAPGRTWAPAWVVWRSGGGYTAWAPAPAPGWRVSVWADNSPAWVCVDEHRFTQPIATVAIRPSYGSVYVARTSVIARPVSHGNVWVNPGPRPEVIATAVGHPVRPIAARSVIGHGTASIARAPNAPPAPRGFAQANQQHWQQQAQMQQRPQAQPQHIAQPSPQQRPQFAQPQRAQPLPAQQRPQFAQPQRAQPQPQPAQQRPQFAQPQRAQPMTPRWGPEPHFAQPQPNPRTMPVQPSPSPQQHFAQPQPQTMPRANGQQPQAQHFAQPPQQQRPQRPQPQQSRPQGRQAPRPYEPRQ